LRAATRFELATFINGTSCNRAQPPRLVMSRKISQETFDDVVRENMEEFDMEPAEALADAIKQFNKQGVDLSSTDISGGIGRQEVLDAISALNNHSASGESDADIVDAIDQLTALCSKENEYSNRNRIFTMNNGGVNSLHILLDEKRTGAVVKSAAVFLTDLSKSTGTSSYVRCC
jgi:hypothetical protein